MRGEMCGFSQTMNDAENSAVDCVYKSLSSVVEKILMDGNLIWISRQHHQHSRFTVTMRALDLTSLMVSLIRFTVNKNLTLSMSLA